MAVLFINRNDSECGSCRRGADPYETSHDTMLGYVPAGTKGCGEPFTAVSTHYLGLNMKERVMEMRPDLPWSDAF